MGKLPTARTRRGAVGIEAGWRALDAATTPREIRDVTKMAALAGRWAKEQGYALDQQIAWGKLRFDALRKLGEVLEPLLTRHRPRKGYKGFRLRDEGISRDLSSLARRVFRVSETVYRRYIGDARREKRVPTVNDFFEKVGGVTRTQHFTSRSEAKRLHDAGWRVLYVPQAARVRMTELVMTPERVLRERMRSSERSAKWRGSSSPSTCAACKYAETHSAFQLT